MLTIKSDAVYGRAKAYESIIKSEPIVGPKLPESFNVLVKELQGLGLRVDLVDELAATDAENVIATKRSDDAAGKSDDASATDETEVVMDEADDIDLDEDGLNVEVAEEFSDDNESKEA